MSTLKDSRETFEASDLLERYDASLSDVLSRLRDIEATLKALRVNPEAGAGNTASQADDGDRKIHNPLTEFAKPADVLADDTLSLSEKKTALETLEQDAHQLLTASNEGMAPLKDHHRKHEPKLDEVVRAKVGIGEKPQHKPAQ
jgi:hypothetical protein